MSIHEKVEDEAYEYMKRPDPEPYGCPQNIVYNSIAGVFVGGMYAGLAQSWFSNPLEKREPYLQVWKRTLLSARKEMIFFGSVVGLFTATKCFVTGVRDSDDWKSSAIAGIPAGLALGLRGGGGPQRAMWCAAGVGLGAAFMNYSDGLTDMKQKARLQRLHNAELLNDYRKEKRIGASSAAE
mmetsp:Transcript_36576/g.50310  ORF Transcript_36576/g.50310 Transcript_36576/m.50310 type:complete len:182 (+) Transcript_36576:36-581(+)|eukprot:CAMPEP_0201490008 /NCGR_PEP_ID=MMETSP0151_2-20130828/24617_1 /ASSEMBLY_ACC=CAM_ASM_000257 /TAXON_ID=200890 /ORGANISM="Paramoeba atlantica, Strain 621/1 / CCAP 1560/9" /LENGTH=181 /DNA_ID=CAMNT_0047875787 /DNA_START=22 /DNA_END=567 /DNA_ORIENTATION=-